MTHLDDLRADVAGHSGRGRAIPLLRLGQALAMEYWRLGPGQPIAQPTLDEAVAAFDEALPLIDRTLPLYRQTAGMLGWLLGTRSQAHGGPDHDRERGVALLETSIGTDTTDLVRHTTARLVLGHLLTTGALAGAAGNPLAMLSGSSAAGAALDRAEAVLRPLLDPSPGRAHVEQAAEMARCLLELGAVVRALTGGVGGLLGAGPVRLVQQARAIQHRLAGLAGVAVRPDRFFFADDLARADPLDRPVAAVVDARPVVDSPPVTGTRPVPRTAPPAAAGPLRAAVRGRLPAGGVAGMLAIVDRQAPLPTVDTVDEWVAAASTVAAARDAADTDHLVFAAALYLRSLVDGGGWADEGADDVHAAATSLAVVGDALLAEPPGTLAAALRLATVLDERRPALRLRTRLIERLRI